MRYAYDTAGNRVSEVTDGDKTTYRYDAAGQLLERRRDGKITRYTYDASGRLLSEVGPDARVTRTYDARGLMVATDSAEDDERTARSFTYDSTGLLASVRTTGDDGDDDDDDAGGLPRFGFRGELHLGDDVYLRARFYQPELGRLTTRDPLEVQMAAPVMANPYVFARNDPVNFADPTGLKASSGSADPSPRCPNSQKLKPAGGAAKGTGARGRRCNFTHVKTGIGTIRTDVYIQAKRLGAGGAGYGDGRKPNPKAAWWQNRVSVLADFNSGKGHITISPTCVGKRTLILENKVCSTALGITGKEKNSGNNVVIKKNNNGTLHRIDIDAENPFNDVLSAAIPNLPIDDLPPIDFCITYNVVSARSVDVDHDFYPSYDTYHNSKDPRIHWATETAPSALKKQTC